MNTVKWADKVNEMMNSPSLPRLTKSLDELIEEYLKLSNRQWKKKRMLESCIAHTAVQDYKLTK